MTSRYLPPCNEGDYLTRCGLYSLKVSAGTGCAGSDDLFLPQVMPKLTITRLPITTDSAILCGKCDDDMPQILKTWLGIDPSRTLWSIYDDTVFLNQLITYICENHNRELLISYEIPVLNRTIEYDGKLHEIVSFLSTWINLCEGHSPLNQFQSMPRDGVICNFGGGPNDINTCPENGYMPWWQSPDVKFDKQGIMQSCAIWPLSTDTDIKHCNILFEDPRFVDTAGTYLEVSNTDFPGGDAFGQVPIQVNLYDPAVEFLEVYQKWVDANKNNPLFDSQFKDAVIIFYGWIKGGQHPTTGLPYWDEGNPNSFKAKVKLEMWGLDDRYKLMRIPNSYDQAGVSRQYIYLVQKSSIPPVLTGKNLLITFDMNTCTMSESIVTSQPTSFIPEILLVKYIPNTDKLLSESNPEEYTKLVKEYERRFNCNKGTCCVTTKTLGKINNICKEVSESECTVEAMRQLYDSIPHFVEVEVISTVFNPGITCEQTDCEWSNPVPKILGTCCIPGYGQDGDWGCIINSSEECADQQGFWEGPQSDGLGGFNPPSCTDRGVQTIQIDSTDSITILLGPRNCSDLGPSKPDVPPVINPGGDIYDPPSACCYMVPSRVATESIVTSSLIHAKTIKKVFVDPVTRVSSPIDITLTLLNDGSIIKLTFPSFEIINQLYPINTTETARNQKIESEFNIKDVNSDNQSFSVKFKKIEGNSIILTTTRV